MDQSKLHRVGEAAKESGVARTTIITAIQRGEISEYATACGLPLVYLPDVKKWAKVKRKPGRKPKR